MEIVKIQEQRATAFAQCQKRSNFLPRRVAGPREEPCTRPAPPRKRLVSTSRSSVGDVEAPTRGGGGLVRGITVLSLGGQILKHDLGLSGVTRLSEDSFV